MSFGPADLDRATRWRATAETWARKATALLTGAHESSPPAPPGWDGDVPPQQFLAGYEAGRLAVVLLEQAEALARIANVEDLDGIEKAAQGVVWAAQKGGRHANRRRVARLLGNTTGRTPEEAAAFRAKAAELGGSS